MSVYDSGTTAYRDTTKWLVAFVPIGSLIAATTAIGPELMSSIETAPSLGAWTSENWDVAVAWILILGGIAATMLFGARVLSVAPKDLGKIQDPSFAAQLATAIGDGVTAPEFLDKNSFDKAMSDLSIALTEDKALAADDPRLTRLHGPIEALRQWSMFADVKGRFRNFCFAFLISTVVIGTAVVYSTAQLQTSPAIDSPVAVDVSLSDSGERALKNETGCATEGGTTFTAVGGTWQYPRLAVEGPGCSFATTWIPRAGQAEVLPVPETP
jgi:hypothetical protein